jgi:hypothetical protein
MKELSNIQKSTFTTPTLYDRIIKVIKGERGRKRTATPDRLRLGNATDYAKTRRSPHH